MNERNEIMGDWYEELARELERIDANENAPQQPPPTDEELEDHYRRWCEKESCKKHENDAS